MRDPVYRTPLVAGNGQPVLLIPGFLAGDWTLLRMAGWLNRLGYQTYFSGIDWNIDCPNKTSERLRWRLEYIANETQNARVTVIGHSLGGLLARFLGANFADQVRHVVALGSPLNLNSQESVHPLVRSAFALLGPLRQARGGVEQRCGSSECTCRFAKTAFATLPAQVRFTSIFSKSDEIVDWRSAIDPAGENLEVSGRHLGLIVNREVYRAVAQVLTPNPTIHASQSEQLHL
jgi:pimeloyl-ACP methyl ester carboxylesterase